MLFDKLFARKKAEPQPEPEPSEPPKPIMTVRTLAGGKRVSYKIESYGTCKLEWISVEKDEKGEPRIVRTPQETTQVFPLSTGFTAAGKFYAGLPQLYAQADEEKIWCKDIYGREVLYLANRFPCFDSCDFLTEKRFYRWFFIREEDKLTRIHYQDEDYRVYVTEDVENLEVNMWNEMKKYGYFLSPR